MRWLIILLFIIFMTLGIQAHDDQYYYAYIVYGDSEDVLRIVDPVTLETIDYLIPFSLDWLMDTSISPDGRYILLWLNQNNEVQYNGNTEYTEDVLSVLRLLDVQTGEIRDIGRQGYVWVDSQFFAYPQWSPDSRYVWHLGDIYDIVTGEIYVLPKDFGVWDIAWSPHSDQIAGQGQDGVVIFNVPEMTVAGQFPVEKLSVCDFAWSPQQTQLVFKIGCYGWSTDPDIDVSHLNLVDGTITAYTHYADDWRARDPKDRYAGYVRQSMLWRDDKILLISHEYADFSFDDVLGEGYVNPESLSSGIKAYFSDTGEQTVVSSDSIISNQWTMNPVTKQIAYWARTIGIDEQNRIEQVTALRLKIASFDGAVWSVDYEFLEGGCSGDIEWSADGAFLAFTYETDTERDFRNCDDVDTVTFVQADGTSKTHSLPERSREIGWIRSNAVQPLFFPLGTPTESPIIPGYCCG